MGKKLPSKLLASTHPARFWKSAGNGSDSVICELTPRQCKLPVGVVGSCGVRMNKGGELVTLNYGKSVQITQEVIESEAVWHYAPGEKILSIGNIGCCMHCDFCHNWKISQTWMSDDSYVEFYTPEELVKYSLENNIRILSWTYNDPVVWHEFVMDTARLAKSHGLINLYKSAFYITAAAVNELLEVIDIFSISLKSSDPLFYTKFTGGKLAPVLDAIEQVYQSGKHLEISNLLVVGRNDNVIETQKIAQWMLDKLGPEVPLHYVRFHPDYKYLNVERTSIPLLEEAREKAIEMGLKNVYIGNVMDSDGLHTYCDCGEVLITRYSLDTKLRLTEDKTCPTCGKRPNITFLNDRISEDNLMADENIDLSSWEFVDHVWDNDVLGVHISNDSGKPVYFQHLDADCYPLDEAKKSGLRRFLVSKTYPTEVRVRVYFQGVRPRVLKLLDRAYFPV